MANPKGQMVSRESSGGKSMDEYRIMLFRWNEYQWQHDANLVLDDGEIAELMKRAFPERIWSKNLVATARHRAMYNRGRLRPQKKVPPKQRSHRYEFCPGGVRQWTSKAFRSQWPFKPTKETRQNLDKIKVTEVAD